MLILLQLILYIMLQYTYSIKPISIHPPTFAPTVHSLKPNSFWGNFSRPFPTNSFFTNFVLNKGLNPINQIPYIVESLPNGLSICYPRRIATNNHIEETFLNNIMFSSLETFTSRKIIAFDQLSVTVNWNSINNNHMESPLVRGSPYITMIYNGLTPLITTQHAILSINKITNPSIIKDIKFTILLNNGQTWILYVVEGKPITLTWNLSQIIFQHIFFGTLRLALLNNISDENILDEYSKIYPLSGEVDYKINGKNNEAFIQFKWKTNNQQSNLLMTALPHQIDSFATTPKTILVNSYQTMKGYVVGIIGNTWLLKEQLTTIEWNAPNSIDSDKIKSILEKLNQEKTLYPTATDPYFFGKEVSAMGRLALIADQLNQASTASFIRENMKKAINPWLNGTNWDALKYDTTWGGICSSQGLLSPSNDFGNGWYNDHHFHYGYYIYAAAVIGKEDKEWLQQYKENILSLVRDVANPSSEDPYFTVTRHKDWFLGHSWASGLFEFGASKNQESTSEAVNCYYGVYLLGLVLNNQNLSDFGRLLLATEIRSAQKYWHIKNGSTIYEPIFAANKVVGVLWETMVDYSTWFGNAIEYIHCIQMIPFTPISEQLLSYSWVEQEYPILKTSLNTNITESWKGFVFMDHAIIDKNTAWNEVQTLTTYDNGNSATNTLYWVATRSIKNHVKSNKKISIE